MEFPSSIRKTRTRETVWKILHEADCPLTAREIAQRAVNFSSGKLTKEDASVSGSNSGAIWLSSVYRALEAFEKEKLVTKTILSDSTESIYAPASSGHHHYAICITCKKRTELEECPFESEHALHTKDSDFMVVGHKVEVFGYCKDCRKKMDKNAKK